SLNLTFHSVSCPAISRHFSIQTFLRAGQIKFPLSHLQATLSLPDVMLPPSSSSPFSLYLLFRLCCNCYCRSQESSFINGVQNLKGRWNAYLGRMKLILSSRVNKLN
ncbi:unnamed protein product, partial [Linum tenue]